MEGVVVIASGSNSSTLIAVTTNAKGEYLFTPDRLAAGRYELTVRAAGYELAQPQQVTVTANMPTKVDLSLLAVTDPLQLAAQLTSLDWVRSFPGSDEQKDLIVRNMVNCGFCHTLERIARSRHTEADFLRVIQRMKPYETDHSSADIFYPVKPLEPVEGLVWYGRQAKDMARYLATINLGPDKKQWDYPLQLLPRPQGEATRAVVTVYPIPRQPSVIHDLDVDSQGHVWYGNTAWDFIGKLNPATGEFWEWPAPNFLPPPPQGQRLLQGVQDIQVDANDLVWVAVGGTKHASFDPRTEKWATYDLPGIWKNPFISPMRATGDPLWGTGIPTLPAPDKLHEHAYRLNTQTGELSEGINLFDHLPPPQDPKRVGQLNYCYMMDQDKDGNFLCTTPEASAITRVDADGKVRLIPTPTPYAYPRRGYRDEQNRFWFTEFFADRLGVIDLNTDKITEYKLGPKYISPYYARADRTGKIWISSNGSDRLMRFDPATGKLVQYLMPVYYDARKLVIDDNAERITVWLPNKNRSELIRVEVDD